MHGGELTASGVDVDISDSSTLRLQGTPIIDHRSSTCATASRLNSSVNFAPDISSSLLPNLPSKVSRKLGASVVAVLGSGPIDLLEVAAAA